MPICCWQMLVGCHESAFGKKTPLNISYQCTLHFVVGALYLGHIQLCFQLSFLALKASVLFAWRENWRKLDVEIKIHLVQVTYEEKTFWGNLCLLFHSASRFLCSLTESSNHFQNSCPCCSIWRLGTELLPKTKFHDSGDHILASVFSFHWQGLLVICLNLFGDVSLVALTSCLENCSFLSCCTVESCFWVFTSNKNDQLFNVILLRKQMNRKHPKNRITGTKGTIACESLLREVLSLQNQKAFSRHKVSLCDHFSLLEWG